MLEFTNVFNNVSTFLKEKKFSVNEESDYDGIIVQKLSSSNTISAANSQQTHIAVTGERMNIFPYLHSDSYFNDARVHKNLKLFYTLMIDIYLDKNNCDYLSTNENSIKFTSEEISHKKLTKVSVARSKRGDGGQQIELGHTSLTDPNFKKFRQLLKVWDYIIILKRYERMEFDIFGIKSEDSEPIEQYNRNTFFYKNRIYTQVDAADILENDSIQQEEELPTHSLKKLSTNIQTILYGPPGTGKSYTVSERIKQIYPNYEDKSEQNPFVFRTTIHPEFSYYDFVGNIQPVVINKDLDAAPSITYDFVHGVFTKSLITAFENPTYDIFLILEEMSRGNIVAIFGDIFQLLDRDDNGESSYTIKNDLIGEELKNNFKKIGMDDSIFNNQIYLPSNLHIIGTVNTSDQNVYAMDSAFKRRFEFEYIDIDPKKDITGKILNDFEFDLDDKKYNVSWSKLYQILNSFIISTLGMSEDKQVGQFFIKFKKIDPTDNADTIEEKTTYNYRQIYNKLLQYLWSDVHLVSMSNEKLFKDNISSFSQAYTKLKNKENIFNTKLMTTFDFSESSHGEQSINTLEEEN